MKTLNCSIFTKLLLTFILMFCLTFAQEEEDLAGLLDLMEVLNTPVVTAGGKAETARKAASNITIITKERIKNWGARDLNDVIRMVAGYTVVYDRDELVFAARGNISDNNAKYLVLIDGHSMNSFENFGPGNIIELPNDLSNVKRIEVVKGPGSLAWGSGALAGVINIITNDFEDLNKKHNVGIKAGSFGSYTGNLQIGDKINDDVSWVLSGAIHQSDGQDIKQSPATGLPVLIDLNQTGGYPKYNTVLHQMDPSYMVSLKAKIGEFKVTGMAFYNSIFNRHFETDHEREIDLSNSKSFFEISLDKKISDNFQYTWKLSHHINRSIYIPTKQDTNSRLPFLIDWNDRKLHSNITFHSKANEQLTFDYAIDYSWFEFGPNARINSFNPDDPKNATVGFLFDRHQKESSLGSYLVANYEPTDQLKIVAGAWLDYNTTRGDDETHLSPRAAVMYDINDDMTFKLVYNHAFLRPANYQAAPGVESEFMDQYEAILMGTFDGLNYAATFFTQKLNGSINFTSFGGSSSFANAGDFTSTGFELELSGNYQKTLDYWLTFSFAKAEGENFPVGLAVDKWRILPDGTMLSYPKITSTASVTYNLNNMFFITPIARYVGETNYRKTAATTTLESAEYDVVPSLFFLDFNARYIINENYSLTLSIHNLLDEDTPTHLTVWNGEIDQRARFLEFGLNLSF